MRNTVFLPPALLGCVLLIVHTTSAAECRFVESPVQADGRVIESVWAGNEDASAAKWLWSRSHLHIAVPLPDPAQPRTVIWLKPSPEHSGVWRLECDGNQRPRLALMMGAQTRELPEIPGLDIAANISSRAAPTKNPQPWLEVSVPWLALAATGGRAKAEESWQYAITAGHHDQDAARPAPSAFDELRFLAPPRTTIPNEKRVPLTTSNVYGTPEPPPPYRVARTLEKLQVNWPVFAVLEPESSRLVFIDQPGPYGLTRICRTGDDPATGEFTVLLNADYAAFSICFHPRFAENGYMYVGNNGGSPKHSRVTRYTLRREPPYDIEPGSERIIIQWPSDGHNGVALAFGLDGMLYVTSGDGTSDSDTNLMGQGLDHLLSKLLRIDVDHVSGDQTYVVPQDNPFVGTAGVRPETWAYGFRNPWRMTVDEQTGDIWVGNNGQDLWEQIFLVQRGANYGWSVYEGSHPFYLNRTLGPHPHTPPTFEHPHSEARSLTGGVVYYGKKFPELYGAYFYGDYSTGKIWAAKVEQGQVRWHREVADTTLQITAFASDADGELLIADHRLDGGFYTLQPNDRAHDPEKFPRLLSQTGLFQSVPGHVVQPGLIPYSVNSPLWSDGADKLRFVALPESAGKDGAPPKIQFATRGPWVFPDTTVLVKSFALNMREGDPESPRFIETRLLTKQEGEWVGYSYIWNDEQTDAQLVAAEGADRTYEIQTSDGVRQQSWHYPSRTECMVCHSRAANYVLGLSTLQLNRLHDYGGIADHQIKVFERLGLLEFSAKNGALEDLQAKWNELGVAEETRAIYLAALENVKDQRKVEWNDLLWKDVERYSSLADPYERSQPLAVRARSYLHANCAQCHVMAGGGNAQMDLDFFTPLDKAGLVNAAPLHHTFGVSDARIVAPGEPARSVLLERMSRRGEGQMPQLATTRVDDDAVAMLREWIESLGQ